MNPQNEESFDKHYDTESSTTSKTKDVRVVTDGKKKKERYTSGKAKRIVIRAKITYD